MDNEINFMDLSKQVQLHKDEYMEAISAVLDDTAFAGGKYVRMFEKRFASYIGSEYCSGLSSGTSALFMAMKALGIKPGDEVIIPANTFIASAWGVCYCGAKPVFVDCTSDTWEIDASEIEKKISEKTKAIIGVHLYGQPFDFDSVKNIADKYDVPIVEDCAQAHGAIYKGKKVGTLGDIGCFSFYPGKNLGAFGEAGAITTNNLEYYEKIEMMKNHGSLKQYYHDVEGYNLRMDGIQGAVLSVKLKYLDEWNMKRSETVKEYEKFIKNDRIKKQKVLDFVIPVWHLFEIETDNPRAFIRHMEKNNIHCGRHYPVSCHLQKVFSRLNYIEGMIPRAEYHAKHCVTLPLYPEMDRDEIHRVIKSCNSYKGDYNNG